VLIFITYHDQLGNTGRKTGFWLKELAAPYFVFKDAGLRSHPRKAVVPRSTPRVTSLNSAPALRSDSNRMSMRKLGLTKPFAFTASSRKVSTQSSSVLPGDTSHFRWAKSGEYVTQVTTIGPLGIEYVDLGDHPRELNCE